MSLGTNSGMRRPPPPSTRPPPPPTAGEEGVADISSSDYRNRLRSKSRARHSNSKSSESESELKKKVNDPIDTSSPITPHDSKKSSLTQEVMEEKKPVRNKVKLLQPPDGRTLLDLDNDLLKRRFKNRAEKYYSPVVLLTDGLYTTSSAKYSLVEDKAQEIGLVIHVNIPKENDPDVNLSPCERVNFDLDEKDLNVEQICDKIHKTSIKKTTDSRKATLIRYDSKTSEDIVATISGAYLVKHCESTVQEAYSILKSKLLSSSRKERMNTDVYLKLVEIYDSRREKIRLSGKNAQYMQEVIKKNLVSLSLNWIPLFIILLVIAVYFRGVFKMVYSFVF